MLEKKTDHFRGAKTRKREITDPLANRKQRKWALIILLLTLLAIGFFWAKAELGNLWNKINHPASFEIVSPARSQEDSAALTEDNVIKEFKSLTSGLQGDYGFYVYSLERSVSYGVNQDMVFSAASINKIPIMLAFYREIEKGTFSADTVYRLNADDIESPGTGSMQYQPPGTKYSYAELLTLSGKQSDNTAAHVLADIIGRPKLEQFNKLLGLQHTSIDNNLTTPREIGKLFQMVWEGGLLKSEEIRKDFFNDLTNTQFEGRIPAGIAPGVKVAHKIGSGDQAYHDCGIIYAKSPYILCVMSKGVKEDEALSVIPEISKAVWSYESK